MITESRISGTLAVTITARVTVIAVMSDGTVILESMGERRALQEGEDLDVACSGIFNVKESND